jgi:hypothetical protein
MSVNKFYKFRYFLSERPFSKQFFYTIIGWIITIIIFLLTQRSLERQRSKDEIFSRFNDLKRDLFSDNLALVSSAVEDLSKEYGGLLDSSKNKEKYAPLAYELLGKRLNTIAIDKEIAKANPSLWTSEKKKLCGKIILFTAYFRPDVTLTKQWELQGKCISGLNIRRTYNSVNYSNATEIDPMAVNMVNKTHSRPNITNSFISDCDFSCSELIMINFSGSRINDTNFERSDFFNCILDMVQLNNCDLRDANFDGSYLRPAMMVGTDLRNALIDSAVFFGIQPAFLTSSPGYSDSTILWWDHYTGKVVVIKGHYIKTLIK